MAKKCAKCGMKATAKGLCTGCGKSTGKCTC